MTDKDSIRARVLKFYYDFNEAHPGAVEQTGAVIGPLSITLQEVSSATRYLAQKGLLEVTSEINAIGDFGVILYLARITDLGIDAIEKPERHADSVNPQIVNQIVYGPNYGQMGAVQARDSATINQQINPSFSDLFAALDNLGGVLKSQPNSDDAQALVDRAKSEASTPKPNLAVMKSLLGALPTVIQVTAAIQPAYELVKADCAQLRHTATLRAYAQQTAATPLGRDVSFKSVTSRPRILHTPRPGVKT
jgi:hypothetical protein